MSDTSPYGTHAPGFLVRQTLALSSRMPDSWLGRRLAFALRWMSVKALRGAPVDLETLGARMRLYPYNNVCEKRVAFTPQYFDARERELLAARIGENFAFIDVGANVGAYALFVAARAGSGARILAVEPQPEIFERLTANIRLNPFGTIKAVACALADKAGDVTLFLDPKNKGESSVKIIGSSHVTSVRVPAMTLLGLLEDEGFKHVDAIKLDVEGAEDLILAPFLRDAPDALLPRLFIIENGHGRWQADLPALLKQRGFSLIETTRLNLLYERA